MNKYNLLDKVSPETTLKFVPGDRGYLQQNIDGVTGEAAVSQVKHSHSLASKSLCWQKRKVICGHCDDLASRRDRLWYTGRGWLSLCSLSRPPPGSLKQQMKNSKIQINKWFSTNVWETLFLSIWLIFVRLAFCSLNSFVKIFMFQDTAASCFNLTCDLCWERIEQKVQLCDSLIVIRTNVQKRNEGLDLQYFRSPKKTDVKINAW